MTVLIDVWCLWCQLWFRASPGLELRLKAQNLQCNLNKEMCDCGGTTSKGPSAVAQSLDELDFQRGLWFAAQYGDEERALYLLNKGCEVDERDAAGYTALHYAARNGHLALCRLLLDRGAYVDAVTHQGKATPLHRAAAENPK